jgi:hypothetical protein
MATRATVLRRCKNSGCTQTFARTASDAELLVHYQLHCDYLLVYCPECHSLVRRKAFCQHPCGKRQLFLPNFPTPELDVTSKLQATNNATNRIKRKGSESKEDQIPFMDSSGTAESSSTDSIPPSHLKRMKLHVYNNNKSRNKRRYSFSRSDNPTELFFKRGKYTTVTRSILTNKMQLNKRIHCQNNKD